LYGLPAGVDFRFFIDLEVTQVCIGVHELILRFSDEVTVTVEGDLGIRVAATPQRVSGNYRELAADAASLLAQKVTDVRSATSGTLILDFGESAQISLYDSSSHYESYNILHGSKLYVI
jgi:Family of unknown function (DUF6188)